MELATRFNGEIINADAMQMYKGLPIITNKISVEEQKSIPHHLLGNIGLDEETWIVGLFKEEATRIIKEIRSRGRLPIVVGGTHYYTKALLFKDSLVKSDDEPSMVSQTHDNSIEHPILEDTTEAIRKKLQEVDPVIADQWHPNDRRKMRRSLEIFLTTGRRASDIYAEQKQRKAANAAAIEEDLEPRTEPLLFWVDTENQTLKERLNRRVDKMVDVGLMDEITSMHKHTQSEPEVGDALDLARGIWQSIGFKEFMPYLKAIEDGVTGDELEKLRVECLEKMKTSTRRYAKYQRKWMRMYMPLLKDEGKLDRLYVLDSTDVAQYTENVTAKAVDLTRDFLSGTEMAKPVSTSEYAREVLTAAAETVPASQETRTSNYCKLCDATFVTARTWDIHIRGKAHKRKIRDQNRFALVTVAERDNTENAQEAQAQLVV